MSVADRALLLSLRPRFAELLLDGSKTVELRRVRPSVAVGATVLLYASSPVRELVGTARVVAIDAGEAIDIWRKHGQRTGISRAEFERYFEGARIAVAITLQAAQPLERPRPLAELRQSAGGFRPPQSFRYLTGPQVDLLAANYGS